MDGIEEELTNVKLKCKITLYKNAYISYYKCKY